MLDGQMHHKRETEAGGEGASSHRFHDGANGANINPNSTSLEPPPHQFPNESLSSTLPILVFPSCCVSPLDRPQAIGLTTPQPCVSPPTSSRIPFPTSIRSRSES